MGVEHADAGHSKIHCRNRHYVDRIDRIFAGFLRVTTAYRRHLWGNHPWDNGLCAFPAPAKNIFQA